MAKENDSSRFLASAERTKKKSIGAQRRANYAEARKEVPINEKMILYTSFHGRGMICNPYALFLYIKSQERFADYTHVWVLDNLKNHPNGIKEYEDDENVIFVEFHSRNYMWYLSTAKYLINNVTEQSYFVKKPGQIVINTWHGIPLKHLGFDIPLGAMTSPNPIRNFLFADYIISPNSFVNGNLADAYKLKNVFEGKIIESGYPRCDTLYKTDRNEFIEKAYKYGVEIDLTKKIILFAPTWRGTEYASPDLDMSNNLNFIKKLESSVDLNKYQVLFKPHQVVYKNLQDKNMLKPFYIPASLDANELLSITDILISDYSSIFFDFLVTKRPILFYIPDLESYEEERGLYFPTNQLPGPVTDNMEQIGDWLSEITQTPDSYYDLFPYERYIKAAEIFVPHEDGNACQRVVEAVFDNDNKCTLSLKSNKKKILFHMDGMHKNGITSSLLNLFNYIDYDKYDVTFYAISVNKDSDVEIISKINPNVRIIYRIGATVFTDYEFSAREYCKSKCIIGRDGNPLFPSDVYYGEYKRCFGDIKFDIIINYSGYSGFWANVYAEEKNAKHYVWMHNDMQAEREKIVKGVNIHMNNLTRMFKHYNNVNGIVGCSQSVMEVNREKLSTLDTYSKFTFVRNLIDTDNIRKGINDGETIYIDGKEYILVGGTNDQKNKDYFTQNLIPVPEKDKVNFITVGRLFPEKNHENLIKAFARLYKENDNIRLYILGEGPLRDELQEMINQLKLCGKIILTGNIFNPFFVEKHCQCFVLPSYHEGMPMVLLEARTLGLPIIVSDFSTVKDSLRENGQLLIQTDVDSIYNGMKAFLEGKVPNEFHFDPEEYNRACMQEFECLIECEEGL